MQDPNMENHLLWHTFCLFCHSSTEQTRLTNTMYIYRLLCGCVYSTHTCIQVGEWYVMCLCISVCLRCGNLYFSMWKMFMLWKQIPWETINNNIVQYIYSMTDVPSINRCICNIRISFYQVICSWSNTISHAYTPVFYILVFFHLFWNYFGYIQFNHKAKFNKSGSSQIPFKAHLRWKLLKASGWSVSHAARPDVSAVGSGNEKIYCVCVRERETQTGSERICVEEYVLRFYRAT